MSARTPLYPRLLRLRHIHPNGWQRAALGEGALAVAGVLVLADLATAWTLLALPLAVAAVVKSHDLVAGALARSGRTPARPDAGLVPQPLDDRIDPQAPGDGGPQPLDDRIDPQAPGDGGPQPLDDGVDQHEADVAAPPAGDPADAPGQDAEGVPPGERGTAGRLGGLRRLARPRR